MEITELLGAYGLIPVVVLDHPEKAPPLSQALEDGGLPVMEITLRTEAGLAAIKAVRRAKSDFILGAGTVLTLEQCKAAVDAGASYIVSPGFNEIIVNWCIKNGIAVIPGCVTPSEIDRALASGLQIVKFFPASTYGGVAGCKALYGPYAAAGIRFVPTGGISPSNLSDYADKPFIHAVGGGWLADEASIKRENYANITTSVRAAIDQLLGYEVAHVGINLEREEEALGVSGQFQAAFGWEAAVGNSSIFSSSGIEVLKSKGRGSMGHLAVRTNSVDRAIFYLEKRGFPVDPESIRRKGGRATIAYLRDEIGGFAVHLLQK